MTNLKLRFTEITSTDCRFFYSGCWYGEFISYFGVEGVDEDVMSGALLLIDDEEDERNVFIECSFDEENEDEDLWKPLAFKTSKRVKVSIDDVYDANGNCIVDIDYFNNIVKYLINDCIHTMSVKYGKVEFEQFDLTKHNGDIDETKDGFVPWMYDAIRGHFNDVLNPPAEEEDEVETDENSDDIMEDWEESDWDEIFKHI